MSMGYWNTMTRSLLVMTVAPVSGSVTVTTSSAVMACLAT